MYVFIVDIIQIQCYSFNQSQASQFSLSYLIILCELFVLSCALFISVGNFNCIFLISRIFYYLWHCYGTKNPCLLFRGLLTTENHCCGSKITDHHLSNLWLETLTGNSWVMLTLTWLFLQLISGATQHITGEWRQWPNRFVDSIN